MVLIPYNVLIGISYFLMGFAAGAAVATVIWWRAYANLEASLEEIYDELLMCADDLKRCREGVKSNDGARS